MTKHSIFSKVALAAAVIASALVFSAFMSGDSNNEQRFKEAALNLDKTYHTLVDEFDYWPECGIRVTGSHLASLISLTDLQEMLPYPLYLSGPHHDGQWDLDNEDDYGHYNPKAIKYLAGLAKTVVSDEFFVERSRPLVSEYLHRQMHIMMVIHDALYNELTPEEREVVFTSSLESKGNNYENGGSGFSLGRLNLEDGTYVYGNVDYRFLHFWARRWSDGTIDLFYDGLSTVFMAYYPDYKFTSEEYWLVGEDEWFGEADGDDPGDPEVYVVIDGSELRLRLEPSTSAETFKWPDGTNRHPKVGERFLYISETEDFYLIDFHGNALWVSKKYTHLE
ncbi:MAG: hypothetical protein K6G25_01390 [Bacteroidales bacterium]|nr:hypothetical protein [Bacteroidales bacterium]